MDNVFFEELVREINAEFKAKERKIALLIDNCHTDSEIENLSHVKLIFLPPNTASVTQSTDQGVIRSLMAHYRKRLVRVILTPFDQDKSIPKISLIKLMLFIVSHGKMSVKKQSSTAFKS